MSGPARRRGSIAASVEWVADSAVDHCEQCSASFGLITRKHHCRKCGHIFCSKCTGYKAVLPPQFGSTEPQRVCQNCYQELQSSRVNLQEFVLDAQYYLRSVPFSLKSQNVLLMGSRSPPEKCYFHVEESDHELEMFMVLTKAGDSCVLPTNSSSGRRVISTILTQMQHPYIYPCVRADFIQEKNTIAVIRPACTKGSLKDLIYKARDSKLPCAEKYREAGAPLPEKQIALFGRQILEALLFMEKKHMPYFDLHTGNIMYNRHANTVMLSDFENSLLAIEPNFKDILPANVDPLVGAFVRVLYEMATGNELNDAELPASIPCAQSVSKILTTLHASSSLGIKEVVAMPFFAQVKLREEPPTWRYDSDCKKVLKRVKKAIDDPSQVSSLQSKSKSKKSKKASDGQTATSSSSAPAAAPEAPPAPTSAPAAPPPAAAGPPPPPPPAGGPPPPPAPPAPPVPPTPPSAPTGGPPPPPAPPAAPPAPPAPPAGGPPPPPAGGPPPPPKTDMPPPQGGRANLLADIRKLRIE